MRCSPRPERHQAHVWHGAHRCHLEGNVPRAELNRLLKDVAVATTVTGTGSEQGIEIEVENIGMLHAQDTAQFHGLVPRARVHELLT